MEILHEDEFKKKKSWWKRNLMLNTKNWFWVSVSLLRSLMYSCSGLVLCLRHCRESKSNTREKHSPKTCSLRRPVVKCNNLSSTKRVQQWLEESLCIIIVYLDMFGKKKKHSLEICWRWNKDAPKHPYSCLVQIPWGRQNARELEEVFMLCNFPLLQNFTKQGHLSQKPVEKRVFSSQ